MGMEPAREKLRWALRDAQYQMKPPICDVYMGVRAKKIGPGTKPSEIVELLCDQLTNCALWEDTVRAMIKDGVGQFYECGPMQQLQGMMKRIDNHAHSIMISVDHIKTGEKEKPKVGGLYTPFKPAYDPYGVLGRRQ